MTAALHNRLAQFLSTLDRLSPVALQDAVVNEVIETGGSYCPPPPEGSDAWASHLFEIALHGVTATGMSEAEAIRNWRKAAQAICPTSEADGFLTVHPPFPDPRNHAEEIENARAQA